MSWNHYGAGTNLGVAFSETGANNFRWDHNTSLTDPSARWAGADYTAMMMAGIIPACPAPGEVDRLAGSMSITNNIFGYGFQGVTSFACIGGQSLIFSHYTTNSLFTSNVIPNTPANKIGDFDAGNFFPASWSAIGFTSYNSAQAGIYSLSRTSPYRNAGTDGKDIGADFATMSRNIRCVSVGNCGTQVSPLTALGVPFI